VLSGMNWAVLFLMAMPYAVGGSFAAWLVYSRRRAYRARSGGRGPGGGLLGTETSKEVEK